MPVTIKYRNGVPTISSIYAVIEEFDDTMFQICVTSDYGKKNGRHILLWSSYRIQDKIDSFITHLNTIGINTGEYIPYERPTVGHLEILPKQNEPLKTLRNENPTTTTTKVRPKDCEV